MKHDKDTDEVIRRFFGFQFKEEVMALSDPINFEGFRKRVDDFYFKKGAFVLFDNGTNVIDRMHRLIVAFEVSLNL